MTKGQVICKFRSSNYVSAPCILENVSTNDREIQWEFYSYLSHFSNKNSNCVPFVKISIPHILKTHEIKYDLKIHSVQYVLRIQSIDQACLVILLKNVWSIYPIKSYVNIQSWLFDFNYLISVRNGTVAVYLNQLRRIKHFLNIY